MGKQCILQIRSLLLIMSIIQALQLNSSSITAITADNGMRASVMSEVGQMLRPQDRVLVGNWNDENFVSQLGIFDTILADYLIGAVDGFRY